MKLYVTSDTTALQEVLDYVTSVVEPIRVPGRAPTRVEIMNLVKQLAQFLKTIPTDLLAHGNDQAYTILHVIRKIFLLLESDGPELMNGCTVEDLESISPDEEYFCGKLLKNISLQTLRDQFGMSSLMVTCYTCLFGRVKQEH